MVMSLRQGDTAVAAAVPAGRRAGELSGAAPLYGRYLVHGLAAGALSGYVS
jgi:hypothetical protein